MNIKEKDLKKIWKLSSQVDLPTPPSLDEAWDQLEQRMTIADMEIEPKQKIMGLQFSLLKPKLVFASAMALFLIISTPMAVRYLNTTSVLTQNAEIENIELSDGSHIQLNNDSKISYQKDFNTDNRTIQLEGEAFFSIENSSVPFIIETSFGHVSVLGTSFNVKSRGDNFEVGVKTGIVSVSSKNKVFKLKAGQFLKLNKHSIPVTPTNLPYNDFPAWLNNKLIFQETNLVEATEEIERLFDITFEFEDPSLRTLSITGVINTNDLQTVLSAISFLTQRDYKFNRESRTCIIQ
ncbi:MAG: DUF4974 domain-containing protein [Candidatus Marinimicrobia bacterium]|jgi:ferric-dicitrate binding protein FerR (iron transport regulator)|nr:DUF4974 domain-containing protein [Candidatus Neomarinimicrobiota bacterium]MBT3937952.1 DUF4974 domain-containing protein [Candidatus Neomarinimicrobiota bacterium]MBT3962210.1 DUF4974 domain-containing protein [Candidatus Neomarinimicrobiota bacterium]MBT4383783.1 DUF4974 domain-containing protein [Candidatus Neomarinimicrobiota bacterium]MBT4636925.1 DUF4974 domain-containing protein [Candidatus Neomarinimicrobiota bacterium]